ILVEPSLEYAEDLWAFRQEIIDKDADNEDQFAGCMSLNSSSSADEWIRICSLRKSERMINVASDYARSIGFERIYIMSGEQGLYEKYGFEKIGDFKTVYGTEDQLFQKN
ncbi:MAG: hypothetical protein IKQ71_05025, partial [Lachnospiraceae bacterium]|nr:hypothetical protein [Lachnospiraceae bacterium]